MKTNEYESTKKKATYLNYIYVVRMCNERTHTHVYIHRMSENKCVAYFQCLSNKQNKNCRFFVTACFISIKFISVDPFEMQTLFWCFQHRYYVWKYIFSDIEFDFEEVKINSSFLNIRYHIGTEFL